MEKSSFSKFRLLMWKNWLLQRRKKKQTVLEIFFSIIFCILLVVIRDLAPSSMYGIPTVYKQFSISEMPDTLSGSSEDGLFSSIMQYMLDDGDTSKRKKRDALSLSEQNIDDIFINGAKINLSFLQSDAVLQLPKIHKFLVENPSEEMMIKQLLNRTSLWARRKHKLYLRKKSRHSSRRRSKRGVFDWFSSPAWPIAYTPNNTVLEEVMALVGEYLYLDTEGYGFATEQEMVEQLTTFSLDPDNPENAFFGLEDILGGIVFKNDFPDGKLPQHIEYKIRLKGSPRSGKKKIPFAPPPRWNTEITYPVFQIPGPRNKNETTGGTPGYYDEGFLSIQHAVDKAIADYLGGKEIDGIASVEMQRMPYPEYIDDTYLVALQAWLPLILLLSYLYPAINIVRSVVYEKENKLKESMKMMGLANWLHWSAWFTKSIMLLLVTSILITILLCTRWNGEGSLAVLDKSDPSLVLFILLMYSCTTITFGFFLSTLFSKANSAATAAGIIWIFSYLPNIYLRPNFLRLSTSLKTILCLYFNVGMSLVCFLTSMFEGTGSGIQWHLFAKGVSPDSPFSIAHVVSVMFFDIVIYSLLTWYIEAVFPGEFGVPQPWNFPLKKDYWFGAKTRRIPKGNIDSDNDTLLFEAEPLGINAGIKVIGLTKKYTKERYAVKNMHLNMFENQITVLLGHNGAGKTTTMSMLTGLFPPSSGSAQVNGYDIVKEMKDVRNSIGICPQHDVLFDELTVNEHLLFFSELKGLATDQIAEEISHILEGIKLTEKANAMAKTLSGGMKRKLSVGIALCAGSKVVILDEPTSGMDPGARRVIWDLLQRERNGRTMLLTTHFMEEADLLGDRIAIMADGIVQCCGSSMFLKKTYGAGYHLIIVKDRDCDVGEINDVIQSHIPGAEIELNVASELSYVLPNENVTKFESLFGELEIRREELRISSYGASQTTMEEVFFRVGENSNPEINSFFQRDIPKIKKSRSKRSSLHRDEIGSLLGQDVEMEVFENHHIPTIEIKRSPLQVFSEALLQRLTLAFNYAKSASVNGINQIVPPNSRKQVLHRNSGLTLILQQFRAMLVKKALFTFRNWGITLTQILIPIAFLILAMVILRNLPGVNDTPPELIAVPNMYDGINMPVRDSVNSTSSRQVLAYMASNFGESNNLDILNPSINYSEYLLTKARNDLPSFNHHILTGMTIDQLSSSKSSIVAIFNNQPYHVPPMSLNLIDQALVRLSTNRSDLFITTSNHPLPRTDAEKLTQETRQNIGFNIGFNLAFGMSFLSASFTLFVIKERSSNCKHLQFVSGVNFVIYWLATALWDFLCFMITSLLVLLSLFIYQEEGLSGGPQLARILLVLVLYCWSILPFMYIASFFFSIPSSGFSRMSMIHIFIGMATLITVTILRIPDLDLLYVAEILDWAFMVFPPYAMASAIGDLYSNVRYTNICTRNIVRFLCGLGTFENPCCRESQSCGQYGCVLWTLSPLGWERLGIGRQLTFLAVEGFLFYIAIAMIEMKIHRSVKYLLKNLYHKLDCCKLSMRDVENSQLHLEEEDNDVKAERQRIQNGALDMNSKNDILVFRDLTKKYSGGLTAVDKLNLGVPLGECFGLLGINGAGKTTTFKMLTGDLPVSSGDAYVNGHSIKSNMKKVQQDIGYCPQFDALLDQLTGRETLRMFARLRGVPESKINECIESIANQLLVTQHLDKQVGNYSGGNKRKISTGIALIGDPPLILLDEPTSGMDPVARRHLWDVLNSVRDSGRCIILTSHSMEECEALCTRIAIMTNGSFRCIGSTQHLKSKFAEGFSIILRVTVSQHRNIDNLQVNDMPVEMANVQQFILATFEESFLREMQWGRLEYFIPVEAASWAKVFGILERNRKKLGIEDYSVTQTTLERVFLNFTRKQRPEKNE